MRNIKKLTHIAPLKKDTINALIERVNLLSKIHSSGSVTARLGAEGLSIRGQAISAATQIRKAYAKVAAGAGTTIVCYLDTDITGEEITVTCEIVGGTALNSAIPRLAISDMITVWKDSNTWRSIMTFQASQDCT